MWCGGVCVGKGSLVLCVGLSDCVCMRFVRAPDMLSLIQCCPEVYPLVDADGDTKTSA